MNFQDLYVGQIATSTNSISFEMINGFANVSGDMNPIHLDEEAAKHSIFKKRIAHGILVASFISAIIGNELPGKGSIYLGQNLAFKLPVFIDDLIRTEVKISKLREDKHLVYLDTSCFNQNEQLVISGDAIVKLPQ